MTGHWIVRSLQQFNLARSQEELGVRERALYEKLVYPKRKADWLLGRLTAKELLQSYCLSRYGRRFHGNEIEILNRASGEPYVALRTQSDNWAMPLLRISISHCHNVAFCALAASTSDASMGVDMEYVAPRPALFADTFYDAHEMAQLKLYHGPEYLKASTSMWSLKEATLKAWGEGLRLDTRQVVVTLTHPISPFWTSQTVEVNFPKVTQVVAWMRCLGSYVLTWVNICKMTRRN